MNGKRRTSAGDIAWAGFLRDEGLAWLFVAKNLFAGLLALWLALRFDLPQPYTAMLTVFVVMRPQSGVVLAKSFYRALGTLAGALATLLLYAVVPQQRVLFLLGLALWVSACTFGAARYRNFASYAFVLSGYTACIIGLPAVDAPGGIFQDAVARVSEVMLGILCAGVVSDVVFPRRLRDVLVQSVRARFATFTRYSHDALTGAYDHARIETRWRDFVMEAIGLEAQRSSTIFENPQTRARSAMVERLNLEFMDANTRLLRLHHWMYRLRLRRDNGDPGAAAVVAPVETLYQPLAAILAVELGSHTGEHARTMAQRLTHFVATLPGHAASLRQGQDDVAAAGLDVALELLEDYARAMHRYASTYAALRLAPLTGAPRMSGDRRHRFVPHTDTVVDLVAGLRAGLALLVGAAIWILTAWPSGLDMVILATVFVALFGSSPNPVASLRYLVTGFSIAAVCVVFCDTVLLPQADGFTMLCCAQVPFLMVGSYMLTRPALASVGAGFNIIFVDAMGVQSTQVYDWAGLLNGVLADLSCVLLALVLLSTIMPAGGYWLRTRMLLRLRGYAVAACSAPLAGQRARFETAPRDLLQKLLTQPGATPETAAQTVRWAQLVMNVGRGVLDLRERMRVVALPPALHVVLDDLVLPGLAQLFRTPGTDAHRKALAALDEAVRLAVADAPSGRRPLLVQLHLLRSQLRDAAYTLGGAQRPSA
ncbi:FUSC family protein [Dyella sp. A6]|uniref:FUSC family protein n=1 Tax=Dyella aluminiiresistens TaxID=3069105 RepID=UPI002E79B7C3|nr:FUSC family protein [Dyella sp. A6]